MVLTSILVPRFVCRVYAVGAIFRQPVRLLDNFRGQLNAPFSDIQAFVINPALPTDDIQVATGDSGGHEAPLQIDRFLKTAEATAFAGFFPACHC